MSKKISSGSSKLIDEVVVAIMSINRLGNFVFVCKVDNLRRDSVESSCPHFPQNVSPALRRRAEVVEGTGDDAQLLVVQYEVVANYSDTAIPQFLKLTMLQCKPS